MTIQSHATEIQIGDYVAYESDRGERRRIEVLRLIRDCGCIHVWTWDRVVTFRSEHPVEIVR